MLLAPGTNRSMGLEEIGRIGMKIVNEEGSEIEISPEEFKQFVKRIKEFKSSSMSGIHNGHYKAAVQDDFSTKLLAQQLMVIARSGVPPENWSECWATSDARENLRNLPSGQTKIHTTIRSKLQFLQPIRVW